MGQMGKRCGLMQDMGALAEGINATLSAILSIFLTYSLLNLTIWQIPFDRLFILAFSVVYALLAWVRGKEIKGYQYRISEIQA
jgi:hypothetical protein